VPNPLSPYPITVDTVNKKVVLDTDTFGHAGSYTATFTVSLTNYPTQVTSVVKTFPVVIDACIVTSLTADAAING